MEALSTATPLRLVRGRRGGMTEGPRGPQLRCGPAGNNVSGSERRVYDQFPAESQVVRRLRRQRQVEQIYRLGARIVFELLDELDRYHDLCDDLDLRLKRYATLDPGVLAALGADRFPHPVIRVAGGGR